MKRSSIAFILFLLISISVASTSATALDGCPDYVTMSSTNTAAEYLYRTEIQIPVDITWGPDGYLYVADWTGRHVVKIDKDYNTTDLRLWETVEAFRWDGPRGLAFDSEGTMYVNNHGHIFKMDTGGNIDELRGIQGSPVGSIAISSSDELFYTDRGQGRVLKWTPEAGSQVIASGIPLVENLEFGLDGTLYLTQMGYPDLLKMDVETGEWEVFARNVCGHDPCFLSVDREGDIWIRAIFSLSQYSPDGQKKPYVIDGRPSDSYAWHTSAGVAVDDEGSVWFATHNSRVSRLVSLKPGTEDPNFQLDVVHTGLEASDLAVDSSGNVYATDLNGRQILRINPDGEAETFVLSGSASRHAVAVDSSDSVYYTTDQGEIRRIDQTGKDSHYANLRTEAMVFGADGILYAVKSGQNGMISIVGISKKDHVFTLASEIEGNTLGNGTVHITPATDSGLYIFTEYNRNLYFLDFEGNGRLIGNYSGINGGMFPMAANPVSGEIYLITHGNYQMHIIDPDGSYQTLSTQVFGDPWGMVVDQDGAYLYVSESGAIHKIPLK